MLLFFGGSGTPVHRLGSLTGEVQGGLRIEDSHSDLHSTLQEAVRTLDSEAIVLICIEEDSGDVTVHFEDGRSDHSSRFAHRHRLDNLVRSKEPRRDLPPAQRRAVELQLAGKIARMAFVQVERRRQLARQALADRDHLHQIIAPHK